MLNLPITGTDMFSLGYDGWTIGENSFGMSGSKNSKYFTILKNTIIMSEDCLIEDIAEKLYNKFYKSLWISSNVYVSIGGFVYGKNKQITWVPNEYHQPIEELANKIIKEINRLKDLEFYE